MLADEDGLFLKAQEFLRANMRRAEYFPELNDAQFAERMYADQPAKYAATLRRLGLVGLDSVLDAGSGYGQWAVSLSRLNGEVVAVDASAQRVDFLSALARELELDNVQSRLGTVTQLPPEVRGLDAVFSYGVVFCTPWKATIREFFRVLKPGGFLCFTAASSTWFSYLWDTEHNACEGYEPRRVVADAFANSLRYAAGDTSWSGQVVMNPTEVAAYLEAVGYSDIEWRWEGVLGVISPDDDKAGTSPTSDLMLRARGIYEMKAYKPIV